MLRNLTLNPTHLPRAIILAEIFTSTPPSTPTHEKTWIPTWSPCRIKLSPALIRTSKKTRILVPLLPRVHLLKIQLAGDENPSFYRENPKKHGDCLEIWTHMFHLPCKIWYIVFLVSRSQFNAYQETKSAILEGEKKHHTSSIQKWKTHNFHIKRPDPKILPPVQHFTITPTSTPPGNRSIIYPNPVPQSWRARGLSTENIDGKLHGINGTISRFSEILVLKLRESSLKVQ